jgi:hypothetical protein
MIQLLVKSLACFCVDCLDGKWDQCLNLPWKGNWIPKHLQPFEGRFVRNTILDNWDVGELCFRIEGDDLVGTHWKLGTILLSTLSLEMLKGLIST